MASLVSILVLLGAAASPAAASIAAWWNGQGAQIIVQNETGTANEIRYSACNSLGSPQYSSVDERVLLLVEAPKYGTPLAGVGWFENEQTIASIFYFNTAGAIANTFVKCDMSSGFFLSDGNWDVSTGVVPSIHNNSGLAAVILSATAGYRIYYHDSDGAINELSYTEADRWQHRGAISQDVNLLPALAATFSGNNNISVASARDDQNIAVTRLNRDTTWFRSTLPHPLEGSFTTADTNRTDIAVNETTPTNFTLSAWDGKASALGISIDSRYTRSLWYIGNDSSLHWVASRNWTWSQQANNQSDALWPQADEPNASLGVAYDFDSSMVRLYYTVQDEISEVKYENGTWTAWTALAAPPSTNGQTSSQDPGLSTGAKAGIGVGVALGTIALGAIAAVLVLMWKKKKKKKQQQAGLDHPDEGSTTVGPDTSAASHGGFPVSPASEAAAAVKSEQVVWDPNNSSEEVQQLDSTARAELHAPQLYEMPHQNHTNEPVAEQRQQGQ
ncbi:hypothetical protein N658DRAFT_485156 [Parathielavia hyrcaniae]|uniref:Fucose-specific lectin n=1 Tax=Parathielavia hyrcaniae TaxID=113614 RepID=A0AAN6T3R9_9PEZI|nr:hypothetical protein N658DRAFT_485156 [Parathielavia hyrcaniae]